MTNGRLAPGPAAQVDWDHPLAAGLTVLAVAQGAHWASYATGSIAQFAPVNSPRATRYGLGYDHAGNTSTNGNPRISGFVSHTGPVSYFTAGLYTGSGVSAFKGIMANRGGVVNGLMTGSVTPVVNLAYNNNDSLLQGPTLTEPTPIAIVGSVSTTSMRLRVNNTVTTGAGQTAASVAGSIEIGGDNWSGASPRMLLGTLNIVGMSLRQWSASEEAMFIADPFCMFQED